MNFEEFLKPDTPEACELPPEETPAPEPEELDVQKAVVESLAADKAQQDEELRVARQQLADKDAQLKAQAEAIAAHKDEVAALQSEMAALKSKLAETASRLAAEQAKEIDRQERNPNALALLDRDVELPDRFPGETRDHALEAIAEACAKAEAEGRLRRAQLLESVLVANEPNGTLAKRRAELEKLFAENGNIVNGPVLAELTRLNIPHKNGEEYLLASEILKRTY